MIKLTKVIVLLLTLLLVAVPYLHFPKAFASEPQPTPTPQENFQDYSTDVHPKLDPAQLQSADSRITQYQAAQEVLQVPFQIIPINIGVNTAQLYQGLINVSVTGGGQSAGIAFNDAFYLYLDEKGKLVPPSYVLPFNLYIDGVPALNHIIGQTLPDYRNDHVYSFQIDVGPTPRQINFAIGDSYTVDNDGAFTIAISDSSSTTIIDSDDDGLWDHWETQGGGIDINNDGTIDLDLYSLGARPDHRDIFLEIDWTDGSNFIGDLRNHKPLDDAISDIKNAFASHGIALHVDLSDAIDETNDLRCIDFSAYLPNTIESCPYGVASFDSVKLSYFGKGFTEIQKEARKFVYHYALFVGSRFNESSGIAELRGNDLIVAIQCKAALDYRCQTDRYSGKFISKRAAQAGTLMHELGHNLGLMHGGADNYNYKPNYISIMNYHFQFSGVLKSDGTTDLDYSDKKLPSLNEYSLTENNGIQDPDHQTYYTCNLPNFERDYANNIYGPVEGNSSINWNCFEEPIPIPQYDSNVNRVITYTGTSSTINYDDTIWGDSYGISNDGLVLLEGHNDWANLELNFRNSWDWLEGYHLLIPSEPELDLETALSYLPSSIRIGEPTEVGIDTDANGKFEYLDISIPVELLISGYYQWGAKLVDINGIELNISMNTGDFTAGSSILTLRFDGTAIGSSGVDGPYYVSELSVFEASQGLFLENVLTTTTYTASQFEGFVRPNQPPIARSQSVTISQDTSISITLTGDDADNDPISYTIVDLPSHGVVIGVPPLVIYTPNSRYLGNDSFTFKANDGALDSHIATVSITVKSVDSGNPLTYILISSNVNEEVPGVNYRDEDIIANNLVSNTWSLIFDGSDVGLGNVDVDAFAFLPNGHLLLSVDTDFKLNGFGSVDDSDILEFIPLELGNTTRGSYKLYFDGSDVGLSSSGEDIDAIDFDKDGNLVISVNGEFKAPGVSGNIKGNDEDLFVLNNGVFGAASSGTWLLYFDGSDVGLTNSNEDLQALWMDHANSKLYFATLEDYSLPGGLKGNEDDIIACTYSSLGDTTSCTFERFWNGDRDHHFDEDAIDGLSIGALPTVSAANDIQGVIAVDDTVESVGDDVDDPDEFDGEETVEGDSQIFLPLINR